MIAFTGVTALTVVLAAPAGGATATSSRPVVMAALGDSISAGFNACGWYVPCVSRSWSMGDHAFVQSHYLRLRSLDESLAWQNLNFAVPGATSADLAGQVEKAVARGADYVTILVGAQDACVSEERLMTPVNVYERRMAEALTLFRAGRPGGRVFVASIPDLKRLWRVGKGDLVARGFWAVGRICPTMLAKPASTSAADRARRDRVRARVAAYNAVLARLCVAYGPACRSDGNAVFNQSFTLGHLSKWDYFHPNEAGQKLIAQKTFEAARGWITGDDRQPIPVP
ncbi:GDSL-type esterase/lipase family protein [Streptosporangium lutulentum]|uniref:Lysophospholipase L1-like esterase n=1 Tax=Streptosporangium lutulentum TaxID=1461250 RepID=A0ABT9QBH7_9ACTN|nr:GDSL-type esterase/lipase family protein [Streptosporangium lutulentum]MDP9844135.1 lysophospholipase L1-like esterase [Streptosporangium lutulentum]